MIRLKHLIYADNKGGVHDDSHSEQKHEDLAAVLKTGKGIFLDRLRLIVKQRGQDGDQKEKDDEDNAEDDEEDVCSLVTLHCGVNCMIAVLAFKHGEERFHNGVEQDPVKDGQRSLEKVDRPEEIELLDCQAVYRVDE